MLRTHTCGELCIDDVGKEVALCGWVQRNRDLGGMTFLDARDRYGITQLVFNMETNAELCKKARGLGREFVIKAKGKVTERSNKNPNLATGDIELIAEELIVLNPSKVPPFTIEDETDGGDDLRMQYRYLDLRRNPVKEKLKLRHRLALEIRNYLSSEDFIEIETPFLIKSTPEGARDFVVPSRIHHGEFYALPQSPQTFKQLLMISGFDKYFQIVRCFRDEDLRADRQPEFTQLDCEMSFVEQNDILTVFEGLMQHLFKKIKDVDLPEFRQMSYDDAIKYYGSDKPDLRFDMKFVELNELAQGKGFNVFDNSELVVGICAEGCAEYSRKQLDELTDWVRRPQIGAKGLVYVKYNSDGSFKSSVDKFFSQDELKKWAKEFNASPGDLILILVGEKKRARKALGELRLEMGNRLELRDVNQFVPLWVTDFPLLEWNEETQRFHAMHHPFTSPQKKDVPMLEKEPGKIRANAYDMVINGVELGGGSIRIHNKELQQKMFKVLGFTEEEAQNQFGFLMTAFEYGAPPHGGIAFGLDRMAALLSGSEVIRDFIAFPKNNAGRDVMIDAPSAISPEQLVELNLSIKGETK
ncbi:MAG: aspartate--tRNA ligase [Flavobacteriales bacterium]|nr:MAG: aspartate--tRNA ligase [Flavobacteriales bacterium]